MSIITTFPFVNNPVQTENRFTAQFNNPTPGEYDFGTLKQNIQDVITLEYNTVYVIDRLSFSSTINENDFLDSLQTVPLRFRLFRAIDTEFVYQAPYPLVNYVDNSFFQTFLHSDKYEDKLQLSVYGSLDQIANTVGIAQITLQISFSIYQYDSNDFNELYRSSTKKRFK